MEQNKFQWTDELVLEYLREMVIGKLGFENNHIDKFKASKTQHNFVFYEEDGLLKTKPKEYEILSFSHNLFGVEVPQSIKRNDDGTFGAYFVEESVFVNSPTHKIDSVRRLSDNEVFSVGDYVTNTISKFKIETITLCNSGVWINEPKEILTNIEHTKQPILTTHDIKDIYKLDKCWYVGKEFEINEWVAFETEILHLDKLKYFSTKEAAESYIAWNKNQFSLAEIMANSHLLQEAGNMDCYTFSRIQLIELAKSKTKTND